MTQLELVNAAMDELGEEPLTLITDTSDRALCAQRQWPRALRRFLREFEWSWAKTTDELTAASPVPDFGWSQRFPLPADFVTLISLNELTAYDYSDAWEIHGDHLFTDEDEAKIEYIYFPSSTGLDTFCEGMDGLAADAFILLLALLMAPKIKKAGAEQKAAMFRDYTLALSKARTRAGNEQKRPQREPASESMFIRSRYGDMAG